MSTDLGTIPAFPRVVIEIPTTHNATVNNTPLVTLGPDQDIRQLAIAHAARSFADSVGRPVLTWIVTATGEGMDAQHGLLHPGGRVELLGAVDLQQVPAPAPAPARDPNAPPTLLHHPRPAPPAQEPSPPAPALLVEPTPAPIPTGSPRQTRVEQLVEVRPSTTFLTTGDEAPAPSGIRGLLARVGLVKGPSQAAREEWEDERLVSQHWAGPRTIAVVNGKGGAGKTPATVLLSAAFARYGGGGVLAWDNNVTRGTLGWRTEQGPHDATLLDLLPHAEEMLSPTARISDLAAYVHHQGVDKYDVLRSNPLLLADAQKLSPEELDALHTALARFYRLLIMDSGNDEGDRLWLQMIARADQIVVPTNTRPDCAEAGRLLLDTLYERGGKSAQLAARAVVIVSQADREEASAEGVADGYRAIAEHVVTVPYDPAMRQQALRWDKLAPPTRRAYLRAAAAIARQL